MVVVVVVSVCVCVCGGGGVIRLRHREIPQIRVSIRTLVVMQSSVQL